MLFLFSMREDVYKNLEAFRDKSGDSLNPEAKRYLNRLIKLGQRNGKLIFNLSDGLLKHPCYNIILSKFWEKQVSIAFALYLTANGQLLNNSQMM